MHHCEFIWLIVNAIHRRHKDVNYSEAKWVWLYVSLVSPFCFYKVCCKCIFALNFEREEVTRTWSFWSEEHRNWTEVLCWSGWVCFFISFISLIASLFQIFSCIWTQLCLNLCILENGVVRLGLVSLWNLVHSHCCLLCFVHCCSFLGVPVSLLVNLCPVTV